MNRWTRIFCGLFFVAFGASMIWGQTFVGQGYIIGALSIGAGVSIGFPLVRRMFRKKR